MREVAVLGIGQTKVEEQWDKSLRELAGEAVLAALNDAHLSAVDAIYVGNMMSGSANKQQHLGAYIADWVGMRYAEALRIEAACSSGAAAFRNAVIAVASGALDSAIAVGVEKMTDSPGHEITAELATAADADYEVDQGLSFVAINALIMRRYLYEFGWKKDDFAPFSINAHANAVYNPFARFHEPLDEKGYQRAPMVADPINLMDASPMGDGSAAAVIVPVERIYRQPGVPLIKVAGSAGCTDTIAVHDRRDPLWLMGAERSAHKAYEQAGIGPEDIDVFELHDAFSIMAALSLEAAGFAERGQGPRLALDGEIRPNGRIPIATRGGLKARGHPVGATGMYQIVEVVQQLRGECGETQVPGAKIGMAQNIGGSGSNIFAHIFKAE
ncbi:acetyl-CoA acetyltransferase [Longilinea arvoryzae]|uniref:Acetyl-CoA acetyltransferase n=1 Tax=Longilinea arvoryzae TaxID=360412 RepID=A0A0S7BG18_9CHLR|nr:thiolase domain-containing protein [Longilinea arvoryzae]GAP14457.1 acetyl-CoA acetyltransferase [Longilinea arvoryzae]